MAKVLVNGKAYDWATIEISMLGVSVVVGATAITYNDEEEMEDLYGQGKYPVSRSTGNYVATGSITLYMKELERLQAIAPNARIQEIPEFDIVVSYIMPNASEITSHRLQSCRFKMNGREVAQNDKGISKEIELQIAAINWAA